MLRLALLVCLFFSFVSVSIPVYASGRYVRRPPSPPKQRERTLYTLGKDIFNGKVALTKQLEDDAFKQELLEYQEQLPAAAQSKASLPEMTGYLSNDQMEALAFYLYKRYKVK